MFAYDRAHAAANEWVRANHYTGKDGWMVCARGESVQGGPPRECGLTVDLGRNKPAFLNTPDDVIQCEYLDTVRSPDGFGQTNLHLRLASGEECFYGKRDGCLRSYPEPRDAIEPIVKAKALELAELIGPEALEPDARFAFLNGEWRRI